MNESRKDGKYQETIPLSTTFDQDTTWDRNKDTINITNKGQVVSARPGDRKAAMYKRNWEGAVIWPKIRPRKIPDCRLLISKILLLLQASGLEILTCICMQNLIKIYVVFLELL